MRGLHLELEGSWPYFRKKLRASHVSPPCDHWSVYVLRRDFTLGACRWIIFARMLSSCCSWGRMMRICFHIQVCITFKMFRNNGIQVSYRHAIIVCASTGPVSARCLLASGRYRSGSGALSYVYRDIAFCVKCTILAYVSDDWFSSLYWDTVISSWHAVLAFQLDTWDEVMLSPSSRPRQRQHHYDNNGQCYFNNLFQPDKCWLVADISFICNLYQFTVHPINQQYSFSI